MIPFESQKYSFKEDMLQIKFNDRFILDVGWQPKFEKNGYFIIRVILDNDWLNPLLEAKARTLNDLKKIIEKSVIFVKQEKEKNLPYRNIEFEKYE